MALGSADYHALVRPKTYVKGPDMMSKSTQMKFRYASSFRNQTKLTWFSHKAPSYPTKVQPKVVVSTDGNVGDVEVIKTLIVQPQDDPPIAGPSQTSCMRSASVLSDPSTDGEHIESSALADVPVISWNSELYY